MSDFGMEISFNKILQELKDCLRQSNLELTTDLEIMIKNVKPWINFGSIKEGVDTSFRDELKAIFINKTSASAKSFKLRNIKYNLLDFLESIGEGTISVIGILSFPVLAVLAFLIALRSAVRAITIELSTEHAIILY